MNSINATRTYSKASPIEFDRNRVEQCNLKWKELQMSILCSKSLNKSFFVPTYFKGAHFKHVQLDFLQAYNNTVETCSFY